MPRRRSDEHRTTISFNGGPEVDATDMLHNSSVSSFTDRIIPLLDEVDRLKEDIKDIYEEAKRARHNAAALKAVVARLRESPEERIQRMAMERARDAMLLALGEFAGTPLGEAALADAD